MRVVPCVDGPLKPFSDFVHKPRVVRAPGKPLAGCRGKNSATDSKAPAKGFTSGCAECGDEFRLGGELTKDQDMYTRESQEEQQLVELYKLSY